MRDSTLRCTNHLYASGEHKGKAGRDDRVLKGYIPDRADERVGWVGSTTPTHTHPPRPTPPDTLSPLPISPSATLPSESQCLSRAGTTQNCPLSLPARVLESQTFWRLLTLTGGQGAVSFKVHRIFFFSFPFLGCFASLPCLPSPPRSFHGILTLLTQFPWYHTSSQPAIQTSHISSPSILPLLSTFPLHSLSCIVLTTYQRPWRRRLFPK